MVVPFSNTKLRVPPGFQSLLVGLSTEVLRSQPRNIHAFAADYFEKLLQRREQGQTAVTETSASLDDRYYNNQSFSEEYPVNDPEVNHAAMKIQANFRGHRARKEVEKIKSGQKSTIDADEQDLGYGRYSSNSPDIQTSSPKSNDATATYADYGQPQLTEADIEEEELTEEEKAEQERAAISIQARFRGFKARQNLTTGTNPSQSAQMDDSPSSPFANRQFSTEPSDYRAPSPPMRRSSARDRQVEQTFDQHSVSMDSTTRNASAPRPSESPTYSNEARRLSDDFERHTQIPQDLDFHRELSEDRYNDEIDMNDPNLEKAATRIQASFRGYKTRKDLGPTTNPIQDQHFDEETEKKILSTSVESNKDPELEEEETAAAAVKIQAAFRGYRTRRELDK